MKPKCILAVIFLTGTLAAQGRARLNFIEDVRNGITHGTGVEITGQVDKWLTSDGSQMSLAF